jgi:ATP-dependent DNA helicase RecG
MIINDEIQLQLSDLKQAIAVERRFQYTDIQGKRLRFSAFLLKTVRQLRGFFVQHSSEKDLETLLKNVQQYPYSDLQARMRVVDKIASLLEPPPKAVTNEAPQAASRSEIAQTGYHGARPEDIDVQFVKGVGPNLAKVLWRADVRTLKELLYYFPKRYLDYQDATPIRQLAEGQEAMVIATVKSASIHQPKNRKISFLTVLVTDATGTIPATWIHAQSTSQTNAMHSIKAKFVPGAEVILTGKTKWDTYKRRLVLDKPDVEFLSAAAADAQETTSESLNAGRLVPVYPLVDGLNHKILRKAIRQALNQALEGIEDPIPPAILKRFGLVNLQTALEHIHFPVSHNAAQDARRRLVFDEFFALQLRLAMMRQAYKAGQTGLSLTPKSDGYVSRCIEALPFQLTNAQQQVFTEIQRDLASPFPMYRLLQGDVGSGKTVIAMLTLLMGVDNGYQGALMVPTEILAEQHARNFIALLTPLGLRVGLFLGKTGAKQRRELQASLQNGQIHIAIGTHALIQDAVEFQNLGVVVIDEQHRFGVRQRLSLKQKGENPELLSMTATPIPRTLSMSLHGDMDISIMNERPPGRTPIKTALMRGKKQREQAYQVIHQQILLGRQAYIVFPLIEESESLAASAATAEFERLQEEELATLRLGLLHGKLSTDERDRMMADFLAHDIDVLVCTTVIEVGVDVPNATVMMIENTERFGLSQLHQLRGRVGRSTHQSYCLLMTETTSPESLARLEILAQSEDGFYIAEKDLELRGPGEFLGTRQSGLPQFSLANLVLDQAILELAKDAAFQLVQDDPGLLHYPELRDLANETPSDNASILTAG